MSNLIRIGTRESGLALKQAETAAGLLQKNNCSSVLVPIKSEGDINLTTPLYELGVQGIFTKALDIALLEKRIDIAVHSYKDVPVVLAKGLRVAAVLKRDSPMDVLVCRDEQVPEALAAGLPLTIATSSIRRKAQWLYRYHNTAIESIRGNVHTRLQKLHASHLHGAIFAAAGLERLNFGVRETGPQLLLDWMLPAPAQGAIVIVCREADTGIIEACQPLNDEATALCTQAERQFLRLLQGGCSTPIAALAVIEDGDICFKGNITAKDGSDCVSVILRDKQVRSETIAQRAVEQVKASHNVQQLLK